MIVSAYHGTVSFGLKTDNPNQEKFFFNNVFEEIDFLQNDSGRNIDDNNDEAGAHCFVSTGPLAGVAWSFMCAGSIEVLEPLTRTSGARIHMTLRESARNECILLRGRSVMRKFLVQHCSLEVDDLTFQMRFFLPFLIAFDNRAVGPLPTIEQRTLNALDDNHRRAQVGNLLRETFALVHGCIRTYEKCVTGELVLPSDDLTAIRRRVVDELAAVGDYIMKNYELRELGEMFSGYTLRFDTMPYTAPHADPYSIPPPPPRPPPPPSPTCRICGDGCIPNGRFTCLDCSDGCVFVD